MRQMKRLLILVITIMILAQTALAFGTYRTLDFSNGESEKQAGKILYEYILQEQNMTPAEIKDFARIEPQSVRAFEIDLNDDGEKEIVGMVYSTLYLGTAGYSLFILQLQNDEYKNIAYVLNIEPQKELKILNAKTNGYRDIKLQGSVAYNFKPFIVKYRNGYYQSDRQTKSLERALQQ